MQDLQNAAGKSAGCLSVQSDLLLSLLSMPRGLRLRLQKADEAGRPKRRVLTGSRISGICARIYAFCPPCSTPDSLSDFRRKVVRRFAAAAFFAF